MPAKLISTTAHRGVHRRRWFAYFVVAVAVFVTVVFVTAVFVAVVVVTVRPIRDPGVMA